MFVRSLAFGTLALSSWGAAPVLPTVRYRIDQTLEQEIDATHVGGAKQQIRFSTASFVTVTLADSADGQTMRLVVDSIQADSALPFPATVLDSARGAEFQGFVTVSGRLVDLRPADNSAAAAKVQSLLSDFFPWVKAGVNVGDRWTDTTAKIGTTGSDSVRIQRISNYAAAEKEARDGRPAIRITLDFTSSVNGTQPTPNGRAKIEGSGRGTGAYHVTPEGQYLGGAWEQRSALELSGAFTPKPLPVTLIQNVKVAVVQ